MEPLGLRRRTAPCAHGMLRKHAMLFASESREDLISLDVAQSSRSAYGRHFAVTGFPCLEPYRRTPQDHLVIWNKVSQDSKVLANQILVFKRTTNEISLAESRAESNWRLGQI